MWIRDVDSRGGRGRAIDVFTSVLPGPHRPMRFSKVLSRALATCLAEDERCRLGAMARFSDWFKFTFLD
jgi:hypothetical protein